MGGLDKHVMEEWQRLYIERWLKVPVEYPGGGCGRTGGGDAAGRCDQAVTGKFVFALCS